MIEDLYNQFLKSEYYAKFEEIIENLEKKYENLFIYNPLIIGITEATLKEYLASKKKYEFDDSLTYSQYLRRLINEKSLTSKDIYTSARISKSTLSKLLNGRNGKKPYNPSKNMLIRIAFATKLSVDEAYILLTKAGQSFIRAEFGKNDNSKKDIASIIKPLTITELDHAYMFLLEKRIYAYKEIDEFLGKAGLPPLVA